MRFRSGAVSKVMHLVYRGTEQCSSPAAVNWWNDGILTTFVNHIRSSVPSFHLSSNTQVVGFCCFWVHTKPYYTALLCHLHRLVPPNTSHNEKQQISNYHQHYNHYYGTFFLNRYRHLKSSNIFIIKRLTHRLHFTWNDFLGNVTYTT